MSPLKYEPDFYIPKDVILHSHRPENLKSCLEVHLPESLAVTSRCVGCREWLPMSDFRFSQQESGVGGTRIPG
jgi:hypothetical protein